MPKFVYPADVKAKIIEAAVEARKAKKSWAEAHAAAKEAGYKGSLQGIVKMLRDVSKQTGQKVGIKRRGRKRAAKVTAVAAPVKRGPGRPRKSVVAVNGTGTDSIEKLVAELVAVRVRAALDQAIAALEAVRA